MNDAKARIAAMLGNALVEREMLVDRLAASEAENERLKAEAEKKAEADGVPD